jgi:hypothetical protein
MDLRKRISRLLSSGETEGLLALAREEPRTVRLLISRSYDMEEASSWRAIRAIGLIAGRMPPDRARGLIQRVLWMMREESGTNPRSGPDILGEVLRANPDPFADVLPVVISFHEEEFLRAGALRAMARVGEVRPDLTAAFAPVAEVRLEDPDPSVRGAALMALAPLGREHCPQVLAKAGDEETFLFFDGDGLRPVSVSEAALGAARRMGCRGAGASWKK